MPKSKDTSSKSLKDTLSDIDNHFGKGTVMRMGDRENLDIPSISTGGAATNAIKKFWRNECSNCIQSK